MPNIKSAKKRVLVSNLNNERNKSYRSAFKTAIKNTATAEDKEAAVKVAIKKVDKAVAKGILHKNTAARKKSALQKSLNA